MYFQPECHWRLMRNWMQFFKFTWNNLCLKMVKMIRKNTEWLLAIADIEG